MKKAYTGLNLWCTTPTPVRPAAVAPRFLFKLLRQSLVVFAALFFCSALSAQTTTNVAATTTARPSSFDPESGGILAEIKINSPHEVEQALKRAEQLFEQGAVSDETGPATFILYGPEVGIFLKENYQQHKTIVDLAARLSAFRVVDIRICEMRLGSMGLDKDAVHPFVSTVPYGPGEVERLIKDEHYSYF